MTISSSLVFIKSVIVGMKYFEWMKVRSKFADLGHSKIRNRLLGTQVIFLTGYTVLDKYP